MKILARVLFHVNTLQADRALGVAHVKVDVATLTDRLVELGDLIALGQVGIKVMFASEPIEVSDLAACGKTDHDCELYGFPVGNR
jgi:hypothetical protein